MADLRFLSDDWPTLSRRLDEALALSAPQRGAWLESLDAPDSMKDALRRLLSEADGVETDDFLAALPKMTLGPRETGAATSTDAVAAGSLIGPYRLIRELGVGGMGLVWLAQRADGGLKRRVALKLPLLNWSRGLAERMSRERDILASLDHPNIARIYDAGLDERGRPYLALEYVEGEPIDVHCKTSALSVPDRLTLVLQVARAVAHAHARLVVHRDLKPANILVTAEGQVRLLDFGIAKLMEGELTQDTQLTQQSGRALTLDYASPEQIRGEPIGAASDVYSLAVVAYELLTEAKPYQLKRASAAALEEAIASVDVRLASTAATSPSTRSALKGDLDAVLNMALQKNVAERYATVDALACDIERHLRGEPVLARPDSLWDKRRLLRLALATGVVTGLGGAGWWASRRASKAGPAAQLSTVAVLPFKPLAAEARDELLEVGMADSLIARLSTVPGLVVRSIGSVRRYAGADQNPLRAARELDVAWIVDGSLQRRGDQLRVTARLLRAADGGAAWSGSFDEKFTGVFEVQDTISARVARVLAPSLEVFAGARRPPLTGLGGTHNTDAYQLYLAAARHAQDMRADGLRKSIALYRQALDIDPGYALAWVGLAETHRRTLFGADGVPSEAFEPAHFAVQRALAVVPNLAEALAEQAFKLYWFDFDWPGAEREFRRVLTLNPNVAMAHFGLASLLLNQDRPDEGFAQMRTARELDPMSPVLNTLEANYLLQAGRRDEARARLNRALDIAPRFWLAHCTQGLVHLADQQPDQAIADMRRAVELADGSSRPSALLGIYLARLGHIEEARKVLNQLLALAKTRYVPPSSLAAVHAALGEVEPALDALDQAFLTRDTRLTFLKDDPRLAGLRNEPRFVALIHKLKLDRFGPGLAPP